MAKGSFNGVISGKKGNTVFYRIKNSNNAEKQGWREYNAKVSNPQSDGQIDQRVKLQAVNNLYRAIKPIIQRGFENHKYGDESRRAFLKLALSSDFSSGPILRKGSTIAAPIPGVPIMYGSIAPVAVLYDDSYGGFLTNLQVATSDYTTIGGLSQLFIANGYKEGDQVTFVWGDFGYTLQYLRAGSEQEYAPSYRVFDFYINTTDERLSADVLGVEFDDTDGELAISNYNFTITAGAEMVLAISVSRDGETSNLRSAAYFAIGGQVESVIYNLSAAEVARRKETYRRKTGSNTNWEQVPGGGGYTPVVQSAYTRAGSEFTPVGIRVVDPGQNQFLCIYDGEGNNYYIETYESSSGSLRAFLTGTGATTTAQPTGMTTANSVDVYDANNVAAGLRAWLISKGVSPTVLPVRS